MASMMHRHGATFFRSIANFEIKRTMYTNRLTFRSRIAQPTNLNRLSHWYAEAAPIRRTVLHCLNTLPNTKIFKELVHHSAAGGQIIHELSLPGPISLFVPTDDAMMNIKPDSMKKLLNDNARLCIFLRHHFSSEYWLRRDLIGHEHQPWRRANCPREAPSKIKDYQGQSISVSQKENFHKDVYLQGNLMSHMDLKCHNGVVHIMDGVLIPDWTLEEEVVFTEI